MKVKSKTKKVLSIIFSLCFIMSCLSEAHAQAAYSSKTEAEQKSEILKKYPPNLSEMQEIGFGVKTVAPNGELVEKRVRPDCHFRGDDGKEYLIFYNNHIKQLKEILYKKLKNNMATNKCAFAGKKSALNSISNGYRQNVDFESFETSSFWDVTEDWLDDLYTNPFWICSAVKLFQKDADKIKNEGIKLAKSSGKLTTAVNKYGEVLDNSDTPCMAIISRDLNEPTVISGLEELNLIEKEIYNVMVSKNSYKHKIEQLNDLLDKYIENFTPEASNMHAMKFCFPLNRISYYLSNFEKGPQDENLETLKAMYALRQKINRLTLKHRFIFEQNKAPILNIKIDRCKIIVEDEHKTMIFLDCEGTKKFMKTIKEMLDSKASVLLNKYPINEPFSKDELRKLAESLDIDSAQDLLDKAELEVQKLNKDCDSQLASAGVSAMRAVGKFFTEDVENLMSPTINFKPKPLPGQEVESYQFTQEEVEEYVKSQRQNNLNEVETRENDGDSYKNDANKDEKSLKNKDNRSLLKKAIDKLNLNSFQESSLMDAFEKYLDYCVKLGKLKLKEDKRDFIKKLKENEEDYVNLLKLYIRLHRGKYEERNDFYGTLVTEDRQHETENGRGRVTREYFIREIENFVEGLKDLFYPKSKKTEDEL